MAVSIDEIKRLKALTGIGLTDAKAALVEADGDFDKALESLRKKGLTKAEKKGEREARQGIVDSYVHSGRIGVILEVNCETDLRAMHIAAAAPEYISLEDVPQSDKDAKKAEFTEKAKNDGKPENMLENIVEGMLKKHFAEKCLLEQPYIKNPDQKVNDFLKENITKFGENTVIRQMARIELGQVN